MRPSVSVGRFDLRRYAAAFAIVALASLVVADLSTSTTLLKFACFASSVVWSFVRLGLGPGVCALCTATLATDYWVLEPVYSVSLDGATACAMAAYAALALLICRFGVSRDLAEAPTQD
jgi:K+-sensing histidine kinase KdpD